MMLDLKILALLLIVNGAPIILQRILGQRWNKPVDLGLKLPDGKPLLGPSKTWRGVAGALAAGPVASASLGLDAMAGLLLAAGAMAGDLLSSFIKRRLGIVPSGQSLGLDQIPEALLPLLLLQDEWDLDAMDIFITVVDFLVLELLISRVLFWLRVRAQPY
ncbi:MAG: CDP-diglyceride synthetase [Proteobacteria bacterium]|nr:CDP-diglyceride synthetase [Pseudomonadota bacterium]